MYSHRVADAHVARAAEAEIGTDVDHHDLLGVAVAIAAAFGVGSRQAPHRDRLR